MRCTHAHPGGFRVRKTVYVYPSNGGVMGPTTVMIKQTKPIVVSEPFNKVVL